MTGPVAPVAEAGGLLGLQRQVGNRAVTALTRSGSGEAPVIRRLMSSQSFAKASNLSFGRKGKSDPAFDGFRTRLALYEGMGAAPPAQRLDLLVKLRFDLKQWLGTRGAKSSRTKPVTKLAGQLGAEIDKVSRLVPAKPTTTPSWTNAKTPTGPRGGLPPSSYSSPLRGSGNGYTTANDGGGHQNMYTTANEGGGYQNAYSTPLRGSQDGGSGYLQPSEDRYATTSSESGGYSVANEERGGNPNFYSTAANGSGYLQPGEDRYATTSRESGGYLVPSGGGGNPDFYSSPLRSSEGGGSSYLHENGGNSSLGYLNQSGAEQPLNYLPQNRSNDDDEVSFSDDEDEMSFSDDEDELPPQREDQQDDVVPVSGPGKYLHERKREDRYKTEFSKGSPDLPLLIDSAKQYSARMPQIYPTPGDFMKKQFGWSDEDCQKYLDPKNPAPLVTKLDERGRKAYELFGGSPLTQGESPEPFDTKDMYSKFMGTGYGIYVMDNNGHIYSAQHRVGIFHHSSFLAGGDVAGAGEIKVEGGVVKSITNKSGHYLPSEAEMVQVFEELESRGVNLSSVEFIPLLGNSPQGLNSKQPYPGGAKKFLTDQKGGH